MIEDLFPALNKNECMELWPNLIEDEKKIDELTGTNIAHANITLNSILNHEEKERLEWLFFSGDGWYKKINQNGMLQIKLAAMSLGLTNKVFTFEYEEEKRMLEIAKNLSMDQQILNMRCYMKQKVVTYYTLKKYLKEVKKSGELSITLYRGVKHEGELKKYLFSGLESWTTSQSIAERFAKNKGYVIIKTYPIDSIFAGNRSTFKNKCSNIYIHNGFFVRREHEMIVENIESSYLLRDNFYKPMVDEFF